MEIVNARQFHIHPSLVIDNAITIPVGPLYKQMHGVLRLKTGDAVRCFDGQGTVYEGPIGHINQTGIVIRIEHRSIQLRPTSLTLAVAIIKNDRMRFVLEKATELGVARIVPMISERVIKRPDIAPPRWHAIVKEAAEQSGHAWLPELTDVQTFRSLLEQPGEHYLCSTGAITLMPHPIPSGSTVYIGPEGGFTPQELERAEAQGAQVVGLGEYQLRADTAVVVALARAQMD